MWKKLPPMHFAAMTYSLARSVEMTVEPTPMKSDSRPPYQIIEKMSRPIVSVPNRNSRHGAVEQ